MAEMQTERRQMNRASPRARRGPMPLLCGLLVFAAAAPATAAPTMEGRQRWALGLTMLQYTSEEREGEGAAREVDRSLLMLGLPSAPAQVDLTFGYGLNDAVLLGARALLSYQSTEIEQAGQEQEESTVVFSLVPRVDIFFGQGGWLQPFASAGAGLTVSSTDRDGADTSGTSFLLQGGVGLRHFLLPQLSVEPELVLTWVTGEVSIEEAGGERDEDVSQLIFAMRVSLSLWP